MAGGAGGLFTSEAASPEPTAGGVVRLYPARPDETCSMARGAGVSFGFSELSPSLPEDGCAMRTAGWDGLACSDLKPCLPDDAFAIRTLKPCRPEVG
jgi:hypothetical protein